MDPATSVYAPGHDAGSARMTVEKVDGGFDVVKEVAPEWLQAHAEFPVVLDPLLRFTG